MRQLVVIDIDPCPKPRLTQRDKIPRLQTPAAKRYFQWKQAFQLQLKKRSIKKIDHDGFVQVEFHISVPNSWSKKKKLKMHGEAHRSRPDIDNLLKALLDSVYSEDAKIYSIKAKKIWSHVGRIIIKMPPQLAGTHLNPVINIDEHYSLPPISERK